MPAKKQQDFSKEDAELMDLLSPVHTIDLRIQKTFEELPDKFVVLMVERLKEYAIVNSRLLKYFCENSIPGIYVTTNKPIDVLIDGIKRQGIDCRNFFFIDAITKMSSEGGIKGENFIYIDSPKNLIDLSVAIESIAKKMKGEKFIIIDSLSTLLVYNKPTVIEKFVHSVAGKMRSWNSKGIFLMVEGKDEGVTKTIAQFCDETIEI
jgi:archaellum biogenesis ATPase FlaH